MFENKTYDSLSLVIPEELGLLRRAPSRWRSFIGGFVVQASVCALLVHIAFYDFMREPPEGKSYQVTELYAPSIPVESAAPRLRIDIAPPPVEHALVAHVVQPTRTVKIPEKTQAVPEVKVAQHFELPQADPDIALPRQSTPMPKIKPEPRTNTFPGSSAVATVKAPASKVQTGGFGDPNGVPANPNAHGAVAIAQTGAFDLPGGPGVGNGTGGSHGVRGTVASAGFGSGIAGPGSGSGRRGGGVVDGGFAQVVATTPTHKPVIAASPSALVPAEVISKPRPSYTSEARQKKIEGEVLLDVVFTADGRIQVLRVVRGLGYGLDEAAIQAAEKIVFRPAKRNGQPIDSSARIHITFQLA